MPFKTIISSILLCFTSSLPLFGSFAAKSTATGAEWSSLIQAIECGNKARVTSLVPSKIHALEKTRGGKTVLEVARLNKKWNILESLIDTLPNNTQNAEIWEILTGARKFNNQSLVNKIVPRLIPNTAKTKGGQTVGQWLSQSSQTTPASGVTKSGTIEFYHSHQPYYEFTNFYAAPINLDGKLWPTTEHYFQAQKFVPHAKLDAATSASIQETVRAKKSPKEVFDYARSLDKTGSSVKRADWDMVKDSIMHKALIAKFTQHRRLRDLLLGTGAAHLVEASPVDGYWGYATNPKTGSAGLNKLGLMLEQIRDQLKTGSTSASISQQLSGMKITTPATPKTVTKSSAWTPTHDEVYKIIAVEDQTSAVTKICNQNLLNGLDLSAKDPAGLTLRDSARDILSIHAGDLLWDMLSY